MGPTRSMGEKRKRLCIHRSHFDVCKMAILIQGKPCKHSVMKHAQRVLFLNTEYFNGVNLAWDCTDTHMTLTVSNIKQSFTIPHLFIGNVLWAIDAFRELVPEFWGVAIYPSDETLEKYPGLERCWYINHGIKPSSSHRLTKDSQFWISEMWTVYTYIWTTITRRTCLLNKEWTITTTKN